MAKNLYLYPMRNKEDLKQKSPYVHHLSAGLKKKFNIVNYGKDIKGGILDITRYFFKADIFYFNWIENTSKIQIAFFLFFFAFTRLFGKKVIWTHHNVHPHRSDSAVNEYLIRFLAKHSNHVIIHTKESLKLLKDYDIDSRVLYFFHPFFTASLNVPAVKPKEYDILIWGNVRKSKGVEEFLTYLENNTQLDKYRIKISGKFENKELYNKINGRYGSANINIEDKYLSHDEMDDLHAKARFVFFPYTGTSVLNSGALITSLPKGTAIIGPNVGAFKDVSEMGLIGLYNNFGDVLDLVNNDKGRAPESLTKLQQIIEKYTWNNFSDYLSQNI